MFLYCLFTGPTLSQLSPALKEVVLELLSTLVCSSTHNNTLQVLQRTTLSPASPKASPVCLYMYYCWRSSYQEGRDRFQLIWLMQLYFYAFPKPGLGFQMSYGMFFFGVQWVKGWWFVLLILVELLAITIYTCLFIMPYLIYWTVN